MRILYGVVGEGMGHATRSCVILRHLVKSHEVQIVVSGRAHEFLRKTFPALEPTTKQLTGLSRPLLPLSIDLADLSSSFDKAGGIENVMRFIYYYTNSINGEDELGHFIRGALQVNVCSGRVSIIGPGCESHFIKQAGTSAASQSRLLDYLMGKAKP